MAEFKPYRFNPFDELDVTVPRSARREALEAAAETLKIALLDYIGSATSPASGGKWTRSLTPGYAEQKSEDSSADFANLERTGAFLDSLTVNVVGTDLVVDVDPEFYGRAEGFLTGQYGESSRIRPRQFVPQGDGKFKRDILKQVRDALAEYEDG
jgi:hypothetical protein